MKKIVVVFLLLCAGIALSQMQDDPKTETGGSVQAGGEVYSDSAITIVTPVTPAEIDDWTTGGISNNVSLVTNGIVLSVDGTYEYDATLSVGGANNANLVFYLQTNGVSIGESLPLRLKDVTGMPMSYSGLIVIVAGSRVNLAVSADTGNVLVEGNFHLTKKW